MYAGSRPGDVNSFDKFAKDTKKFNLESQRSYNKERNMNVLISVGKIYAKCRLRRKIGECRNRALQHDK